VGADPHNILEPLADGGYLGSHPVSAYYIFTTYDSARGITSMIKKVLDIFREI